MKILGIETSCDETAISLVDIKKKQGLLPEIKILSDKVASQVKLHAPYGGVVPALAAREHVKNIDILFKEVEKEVLNLRDKIDKVAVTVGPGLMPALLVGTNFAKALAYKFKKPLIAVNHLEGHLFSSLLNNQDSAKKKLIFPALGLIVSGGHTELVLVKDFGVYEIIGETLDDAAGEAFDKVARLLELGYPGGPLIQKLAAKSKQRLIDLPRPMANADNYNFSFAGLKTAVLYKLADLKKAENLNQINQEIKIKMAASFQQAVIDTLIIKTNKALKEFKIKTLVTGGGVLANQVLRDSLEKLACQEEISLFMPKKIFCGDNASMIALAGFLGNKKTTSWQTLIACANLNLGK
jgi:N6-L-threonylcarbamoyladenine synthase